MKQAEIGARRSNTKRDGAGDILGSNSEIGRKLKQYYDELIAGDIPDRFTELLDKLERQEEKKPAAERE